MIILILSSHPPSIVAQLWTYTGASFKIFDNMCLDVTDGKTNNGNKIQIWECFTGNTNQQWSVTADNRIAWTNKHECLDLTDGVLSGGSRVCGVYCS
jgi:hypothetical protein